MGTLLGLGYTESALEALKQIDSKKVRRQIVDRVNELTATPHPPGSLKVQGTASGDAEVFRIRQGDYRVLYTIRNEAEIIVLDIGHRKEIYRRST